MPPRVAKKPAVSKRRVSTRSTSSGNVDVGPLPCADSPATEVEETTSCKIDSSLGKDQTGESDPIMSGESEMESNSAKEGEASRPDPVIWARPAKKRAVAKQQAVVAVASDELEQTDGFLSEKGSEMDKSEVLKEEKDCIVGEKLMDEVLESNAGEEKEMDGEGEEMVKGGGENVENIDREKEIEEEAVEEEIKDEEGKDENAEIEEPVTEEPVEKEEPIEDEMEEEPVEEKSVEEVELVVEEELVEDQEPIGKELVDEGGLVEEEPVDEGEPVEEELVDEGEPIEEELVEGEEEAEEEEEEVEVVEGEEEAEEEVEGEEELVEEEEEEEEEEELLEEEPIEEEEGQEVEEEQYEEGGEVEEEEPEEVEEVEQGDGKEEYTPTKKSEEKRDVVAFEGKFFG